MIALIKERTIVSIRDKTSLFFSFVFPVVLLFILGNMLANLDTADSPIGTIRLGVTVQTSEAYEEAAIDGFLDALSENADIEITYFDEAADAQAVVNGEYVTRAFHAYKYSDEETAQTVDTEDLTLDAAILFESPMEITITEGTDYTKNRAVQLMVQSFTREYTAAGLVSGRTPENLATLAQVMAADTSYSEMVDAGVNRTMMDYYAIAMIVMISFMGGGIGGASAFFEGKQDGTTRRVCASPISATKIYFGFISSSAIQGFLQSVVIMIPATFVYGAHYADKFTDNLLLLAFFVLMNVAVSAVCALIGMVVKFSPFTPLMAIFWVILFFSGTFSKEINIGIKLPPALAQEAAFDLTMFGRPEKVLVYMAVLAVLIIVFTLLGNLALRKKNLAY